MVTQLNDRFCLRNQRRNFSVNFRLNPDDRAAYFGKSGINTAIIDSIHERYMLGSQPKKYLYGQYGAGKTHTLYNIKYHLEESPEAKANTAYQVRCRPLDAEFKEKTSYSYLHAQMMEAVTLEAVREVVQEYLANNAGPQLEERLRNDFGDANTARAIRALGYAGEPIALWKWLCGGALSSADLTSYSLTKNMDTVSEMYRALVGIMRLFVKKNINYLFLFDEMEGLQNVRNQDCRESFQEGFRKLADDDNDVVGFVLSVYGMREEDIPQFIYTEAIITRLNRSNIHGLEYLQRDEDIRHFLTDLFSLVIDPDKKSAMEKEGRISKSLQWYPLTNDAMDELVALATSAPTASLPRNFISTINECAVQAARRDSFVIDHEDLKPAQAIFTEFL